VDILIKCQSYQHDRNAINHIIDKSPEKQCNQMCSVKKIIENMCPHTSRTINNSVSDVSTGTLKIPFSTIQTLRKKLKTALDHFTRKQLLVTNNAIDCIFCTDHTGHKGVAIIHNSKSSLFSKIIKKNIMTCLTCERKFCRSCNIALNSNSPHKNLSCIDFAISKVSDPSEKLILQSTMKCPQCMTPIHKHDGCQHMQCTQCQTHFCYTCGDEIDRRDPSEHFRVTSCRQFI
jgi:hypothetical protein